MTFLYNLLKICLSKLMLTSNKDYVIDVQSGTVTISNLELAGAKKSEIKVGKNSTVTVDNVDVSDIKKSTETARFSPNSGILVEGTLNASNITNSKETYDTPSIAILCNSSYSATDECTESPTAVVKTSKMTDNIRYVNVTKGEKIDSSKTYYGHFYYVDNNKSKIYFMGVKDKYRGNGGAYDLIKFYFYDDTINLEEMGYKIDEAPSDATEDIGNKVFKY